MDNNPRLVMSQGPQPGQTFVLDQDSSTIGRDPGNDITVNDPQVSRQHARITRQGNLMVIEDLGSTNGTFVNGMRLTGTHTLANGDVIGLGDGARLTYYGAGATVSATETLVGQPAPAPTPGYTPPPPPPPPAPRPTAPPMPGPGYAPPPPVAAPAQGGGKSWLWIGCGIVVLLVIMACVAMFVLDYFSVLPAFFYTPLQWLGLV